MSEQPRPTPASLREVADLLRAANHLDPEAQERLADLMDELSQALQQGALTDEERRHLTESAAELARALHEQHDEGLLNAAKHRLESAARKAEIKAPLATSAVRQIIDALASLGI